MRILQIVCLGSTLLGCRGAAQSAEPDLGRLVDSLMPAVERAAGMRFAATPRSALRSRDEVRAFLVRKTAAEFSEARLAGLTAAYRLLGLVPDTLDLRGLVLDLLTEQVAGFYDPDSLTLYGVRGADPTAMRLVVAHELVHALQHQVLPLDSLLGPAGAADGDRQAAWQAVLEGHATLISLRMLVPDPDLMDRADFWENYRDQVRQQQARMPVFRESPLVLREGLLFPYLSGAEFMRWWIGAHPDRSLPRRDELPASTEQVLFPSRYTAGDQPVAVQFVDSSATVEFEDTLGELGLEVLQAVGRGVPNVVARIPVGWGGDRYRVYRGTDGAALVWYTVWDTPAVADRFAAGLGADIAKTSRPGYRGTVDAVTLGDHPGVRLVLAPAGWAGWKRIPGGTVDPNRP